jgi:MoxR-like ATPase
MSESQNPPAMERDDVEAIDRLREAHAAIRAAVATVIVGQEAVVEKLLICLFARGHGLLMGVPGLAKTLLVHAVSETLELSFSRIQFTPDLMPSDITGTEILQETDRPGRRAFEFSRGPIFANIVLADEINRTPPKTQAALLQAMQENQVSVGNNRMDLPRPFFVLATQNPIEQEGTYPLPEAQLDRFMFLIEVDYPTRADELRIARETTGAVRSVIEPVLHAADLSRYQELVRRVPVPEHVYEEAVDLVRATRPRAADAPRWIRDWVSWGAGPRAVQYLVLGAKARAVLRGSYLVSRDDLHAVAEPVLAHRILTNFQAESEGVRSRDIVTRLLAERRKD